MGSKLWICAVGTYTGRELGIDVEAVVDSDPATGVTWMGPAPVYALPILGDASEWTSNRDLGRFAEINAMAARIASAVRTRRVAICCRDGGNRSCLLAALAYRLRFRCTGLQAMKHVERARPGAFTNRTYRQLLVSLLSPR